MLYGYIHQMKDLSNKNETSKPIKKNTKRKT